MSRCSVVHLRQAKKRKKLLHLSHFYTVNCEFAKAQLDLKQAKSKTRVA
jgi:hypothetical protein